MSHRLVESATVCGVLVVVVLGYQVSVVGQRRPADAAAKESRGVPRTPWGAPDLQGVWSSSTTTPMERPPEFAGKEFLTPQEADAWSKKVVENRDADRRKEGIADLTAAYNNAWYDWGTKHAKTLRSSLVTDPPDGRIPPLTSEG